MFKDIPLDRIVESPTNPRKRFDDTELAELAESIRAHGVLQPILVRKAPDAAHLYEVVSGARRLRASKLAEEATIPARVVKMGDDEVLEVQIVENLQRSEVHPLDEAAGFAALAEQMPVPVIAGKVGKSEAYVLRRLRLNVLVERGKGAFFEGHMTLGHAEALARLRPEDQEEALDMFWGERRTDVTVVQFKHWIERSLLLDLDEAAFRREDAKLVPSAGSCVSCPKRSGAQPALFEDLDGRNLCLDRACFDAKTVAHWEQQRKLLVKKNKGADVILIAETGGSTLPGVLPPYQWDEAEEGEDGAVLGLLVRSYDDERVGTSLWIVERQKDADDEDEAGLSPDEQEERAELRREEERQAQERAEKEREKAEVERLVMMRALKVAVFGAAKKVSAPNEVFDALFEETINACDLDDEELGELTNVEWVNGRPSVPLRNEQKIAVSLFMAHYPNLHIYGEKKAVVEFLEAFDVDVKAIRADVKKERKAAKKGGE